MLPRSKEAHKTLSPKSTPTNSVLFSPVELPLQLSEHVLLQLSLQVELQSEHDEPLLLLLPAQDPSQLPEQDLSHEPSHVDEQPSQPDGVGIGSDEQAVKIGGTAIAAIKGNVLIAAFLKKSRRESNSLFLLFLSMEFLININYAN